MDLPPADLVFVDDWPEYVQKAGDMGMGGVVIDRNREYSDISGIERIENLTELIGLLDSV